MKSFFFSKNKKELPAGSPDWFYCWMKRAPLISFFRMALRLCSSMTEV
jgi:hypothetical protein